MTIQSTPPPAAVAFDAHRLNEILPQIDTDPAAMAEALTIAHNHMRAIAANVLREQSERPSLTATELANLVAAEFLVSAIQPRNLKHFWDTIALAIRRELATRAVARRTRLARERAHALPITNDIDPERILMAEEEMVRLEHADRDALRIVHQKYVLGRTDERAAAVLEITPERVRETWSDFKYLCRG